MARNIYVIGDIHGDYGIFDAKFGDRLLSSSSPKEDILFVAGDAGFINSYENEKSKSKVPIWQKSNLTIEEAAEYSGIGRNKLRQLSDNEKCPFVLWVGNKRLIKRRELDEYTGRMYSI